MFDILFKNRQREELSLYNIIAAETVKVNLSKCAIEKAVTMIAKAVAKSEIVMQGVGGLRRDSYYYRLNVRPNDNESGTEFWMAVVRRLLLYSECLIVRIQDKYYIADAYDCDCMILRPRKYSNINLCCAGKSYALSMSFSAEDVIHLRYDNANLRRYLENVVRKYDSLLSAVAEAQRVGSLPKYKFRAGTQLSFRKKGPDGKEKKYTKDEYLAELKSMLEEDSMSIITEHEGISLEQLNMKFSSDMEDVVKIAKEINSECAAAFDIPAAVFFGNITEKSDASNEFITYAVSPIAETISDGLNTSLVGEADYLKGERVQVWLARFKHIDVVDCATSLDKLRAIGFSLDEIREMVGYFRLGTEFSTKRALTKNYSEEDETDT